MSEEAKEDMVANRMTLVPAVAVYTADERSSGLRGRLGVTASNITCAPQETETEPSLGTWSATGTRLELLLGPADCGPKSGRTSNYVEKLIGLGRQKMMVSTEALVGVVDGRSAWGNSGDKAGRLLVWKWSYDDIDEIYVGRIKKMFKMWDAELMIKSKEPKATLHYSGYGQDADVFRPYDSKAKAANVNGSHLLSFAQTLSQAVSRHRHCAVNHSTKGTKETEDVFTFS